MKRRNACACDVEYYLITTDEGTEEEALSRSHPEHPLPSEQRLIFAGRLLVDGAQTADVLRQVWRCARRMALDSEPHPNSRHKTHEGSLSLCCMCAFASDS